MRTILAVILLLLLAAVACTTEAPEGTTKQATPVKATPIIVPSPTAESTATPEPTATATSASKLANATRPITPTPTPTVDEVTNTPTPTATREPTAMPTPTATPTPLPNPEATPETTPTQEPLATLPPITPNRETPRPSPMATIGPTPNSPISQTPTPSVKPPLTMTIVAPGQRSIPAYARDRWRHWVDADKDCQDARQEVLIAESVTAVAFTNADQCRVSSGQWVGPYTGETFSDPSDLDIDHMVPLANAHRSGAWAWLDDRRQAFANYLPYEGHLIAVKASANRSKGAKGPEEWKPSDASYWCQYAVNWIVIKSSWGLTATEDELASLQDMLASCDSPPELIFLQEDRDSPTPSPGPTPTPAAFVTYESCEAALAAGEERVKGSIGNGRGFPAEMVPSARDGDGDGVVCET